MLKLRSTYNLLPSLRTDRVVRTRPPYLRSPAVGKDDGVGRVLDDRFEQTQVLVLHLVFSRIADLLALEPEAGSAHVIPPASPDTPLSYPQDAWTGPGGVFPRISRLSGDQTHATDFDLLAPMVVPEDPCDDFRLGGGGDQIIAIAVEGG